MTTTRRPAPPTLEQLRDEYVALWHSMEVRPERRTAVKAAARLILAFRGRYEVVADRCGSVPWWLVGIIHVMESGGRFDRHLHNGDPLTGPTVQVPKGRPTPEGGPFEFEDSAADALCLKRLDEVRTWDLPRVAWELERYNGWGYRLYHPDVLSPYLWAGTTHYTRGKYVADGKWSATAVSSQPGAMAILHELTQVDDTIVVDVPAPDPVREHVRTPEPVRLPPAGMMQSTTGNTAVAVGAGAGVPQVGMAVTDAAARATTWREFALALGSSPLFWTGLTTIVGTLYIWLERRRHMLESGV